LARWKIDVPEPSDAAQADRDTFSRHRRLQRLDPLFKAVGIDAVKWSKSDPDLDPIRDHPRFKAMLAAAETRLAQSS